MPALCGPPRNVVPCNAPQVTNRSGPNGSEQRESLVVIALLVLAVALRHGAPVERLGDHRPLGWWRLCYRASSRFCRCPRRRRRR